jgi:hypothetical protein
MRQTRFHKADLDKKQSEVQIRPRQVPQVDLVHQKPSTIPSQPINQHSTQPQAVLQLLPNPRSRKSRSPKTPHITPTPQNLTPSISTHLSLKNSTPRPHHAPQPSQVHEASIGPIQQDPHIFLEKTWLEYGRLGCA